MITITQADLTLVQDSGRSGYECSGVARSGAWDLDQYRRMQGLLGQENPIVFEVLAGTFEFTTDQSLDLALTGFLTSNVGVVDQLVSVPAGSVRLTVSTTSYVGIVGLRAAQVLGSSATDTVSGLGPDRVAVGQKYEANNSTGSHRLIRSTLNWSDSIRFIPGPHGDLGEVSALVTSAARSGIRLQAEVVLSGSLTLPSLPILPGAIQYTGRELIIVGPDGGVSGGYPVVGVVVGADLGALARLREGERISLKPITLANVPQPDPITVVNASAL